MDFLTDDMAIKAFAKLPDTFDSHDVEFKMRSMNPGKFQKEQNRFRNSKDPVHSFSCSFGRWLLNFAPHIILKTDNRPLTLNLRGTICANQEWKKK